MQTQSTPRGTNLVELVQQVVRQQEDKPAFTYLVDGESKEISLSYNEWERKTRAVAARLQQSVKQRDRVITMYPPGLDSLPAFFGCLYAGVVAVPATPPRPNQSLDNLLAVIADTAATTILTHSLLLPQLQTGFAQLPGLRFIATDQLDSSLADSWRMPDIKEDDVAFLHFTSGSTKNPRGIRFDHDTVLFFLQYPPYQLPDPCTFVSWFPFNTGVGLLTGALMPVANGSHTVLMSPFDFGIAPVRWLRAISKYKGGFSGSPNFGYQLCLDQISPEQCEGLDLSSWEIAFWGTEPVRSSVVHAFHKKFAPYGLKEQAFYTGYGLSEAMFAVTVRPGTIKTLSLDRARLENLEIVEVPDDHPRALKFANNGKPVQSKTVRIIDPDSLKDCPPDRIGEIWVQSASPLRGYWNNPEETKNVFEGYLADGSGPFLRTGDLGLMRDGELYITGRIKDIIILQGRNIYAQDIEQVAEKAHPDLQAGSSAAFSIMVGDEEQLALVMEIKPGVSNPDSEEITRAVRRAIAEDLQLPVYAVGLIGPNSIPRTASGKVQRFMVRKLFLEQSEE